MVYKKKTEKVEKVSIEEAEELLKKGKETGDEALIQKAEALLAQK